MAANLDILKVARGAFLIPWWNRNSFARALAVPLAAIVAWVWCWAYLAENLPQSFGWVLWAPYVAFFVLFAVTCHRLVLLDPDEVARQMVPRWGWRETRFALMLVVIIGVALMVVMAIGGIAATALVQFIDVQDAPFDLLLFVVQLPAYYLVARLSILLPALAVDEPLDFRWAWSVTRGNGWRLVILVAFLPFVLTAAVNLLYRSSATLAESVILSVVGYGLLAIEVTALSLSYYELARARPR